MAGGGAADGGVGKGEEEKEEITGGGVRDLGNRDVKARPRLTGRGRAGKAEEAPVMTASLPGRRNHDHFGRSVPSKRTPDADNGTDCTKRGAYTTGGRATVVTTTSFFAIPSTSRRDSSTLLLRICSSRTLRTFVTFSISVLTR
jgi:hypothetical protein